MADASKVPPVAGASATAADRAVQELDDEIAAVLDAAADWGVRPDHLEGRFVTAWLNTVKWLGRLMSAAISDLKSVIQQSKAASDAEAERLRQLNRQALSVIETARAAQIHLEIQRETVVAKLLERIGPELSDGIKYWRVIKEKEYNRRSARRLAAGTVAIALFLILGSYFGRAWQDSDATEALARCSANLWVDPSSKRVFCDMTYLAPEASNSGR
jgi:hypothetical protein